LDRVAQRSWAQFFTTLGAKQHQGTYFQIGRSFWLKEGSLIDLLREERTDSAAPFNIALNQGKIRQSRTALLKISGFRHHDISSRRAAQQPVAGDGGRVGRWYAGAL